MKNALKRKAEILIIELEALKAPNDSVENTLNLLNVILNDAEEITQEILRQTNDDEAA